MRIHDVTICCQRRRAAESVLLLVRERKLDTTLQLSLFLLRTLKLAMTEAALRKELECVIHVTQCDLNRLDDNECLTKFRFRMRDLNRLGAILRWPFDLKSANRRRYRTWFTFSICLLFCRLRTVFCFVIWGFRSEERKQLSTRYFSNARNF